MKRLSLENIWFYYHEGSWVLEDLSWSLSAKEFWGILGPNGSGKTTLLKVIDGILKPRRGLVRIDDRDIGSIGRSELARLIAVVPQESDLVFPFTVEEVVLMGRAPHLGRFAFESDRDRDIAGQAMERTGILPFARRNMNELSGGERQRVLIARALAQQPRVMLLDEPTAFLDIKYQKTIFDLVTDLNHDEGIAIVAVTHDLNLASLYCDKLLLLRQGKIHSRGSPEEVITEERIASVYETDVRVERDGETGRPRVVLKR